MNRLGMILLAAAVFAATTTPSEARRHGRCGYGPYYDYSHSSFLSPLTYVFPAANWGPFASARSSRLCLTDIDGGACQPA
jgi:hypothetical protein